VTGREPSSPGSRPRAVWNLADQAVSSLATFAVTILAAAAGTAEEFGHFAVAFALYLFLLGVSQALVNQVFLMRFPAASEDEARRGARAASGLAFVYGLACAAVVVPAALLFAGTAGPAIATIAALFPVLFVQEAWRGVLIGRGRARAATVNDSVRTVLQLGSMAAVIVSGRSDPTLLLAAWGAAAAVAAVLGGFQVGGAPSPAAGLTFARRHADISRFLVAEWLLVLGAAQVGLLAVAWLGSPTDVGSLRGSQTLLGPMNILGLGVFSYLLTELVRRPDLDAPILRRVAAAAGGVLALISVAWGLCLLALPDAVGTTVLGDTWSGARATILPMTFYVAGAAGATGTLAVLRSMGDARSTFLVNTVLGPLILGGVVIGQITAGAPGAAWGFAAATTLVVPLFWLRMERTIRGRSAAPERIHVPRQERSEA
jgi:O-antigen/teichoic acid export membrane protein